MAAARPPSTQAADPPAPADSSLQRRHGALTQSHPMQELPAGNARGHLSHSHEFILPMAAQGGGLLPLWFIKATHSRSKEPSLTVTVLSRSHSCWENKVESEIQRAEKMFPVA